MGMSIGELADRAGLTASTIRYYEDLGLLPRAARASGRRVFDDRMLDQATSRYRVPGTGYRCGGSRTSFDVAEDILFRHAPRVTTAGDA